MTDRIFIRKCFPCERFADDGYGRAPIHIGICEVASVEEPHAHCLEITRSAQPITGLGQETEVTRCAVLPFNRVCAAGVVLTCRQPHNRASRANIRDMPEAFDNIVDRLSRAKIILETGLVENRTTCRCVCIRHQQMVFAETERDVD